MSGSADRWRTTPLGAAVTIIGIGSVVGLVGWPRETAYALSALAGLLALVGGVLKLRGELDTREAAEAPADQPDGERCCVCGAHRVIHQVVTPANLCGDCFLCRCGQVPCVRTGINDPAVSTDAAGRCAGCPGCGGPDCIQRPDDLTAQEARDLADDLGLQLYRAQDAIAFVAEMCDIADEHRGRRGQPATVTTARVREWLRGAQCARQAGLVLDPDASGKDPETGRTDPDTTGHDGADQDGHHPDDADTAVPTMAPTYPPLDPTTPPTPHWDDPTRDLRMATGTPVPTVCRLIAAMAEKATEHQLTDAEVQHLFDAATAVGHIEVRLHTHVCGQGDGE